MFVFFSADFVFLTIVAVLALIASITLTDVALELVHTGAMLAVVGLTLVAI